MRYPILYKPTETDFENNGVGILSDCIECTISEELNGAYELKMQYPIGGIHYESIVRRGIIKARVNAISDPQLFRIYSVTRSMRRIVNIFAEHISYDLSGIPVSTFLSGNVGDALRGLKDNAVSDCPFYFWTDKNTLGAFNVPEPGSIRSQLGGKEGSILDVYGGEYEFDNFTVKLHNRRGYDRGVTIRYGKNLTNLEQDENCASCYTAVYPYWIGPDGDLIELPEKVVNAPGTYDYERVMTLNLSQDFAGTPTEDQIRQRAVKYIDDNDIGVPKISWKIAYLDLEKSEEYRGMALLERVLLGDTVSVEFPSMGVSVRAKVVAYECDSLHERNINITLGRVKSDITDTIVEQKKETENIVTPSLVQSIVSTLTATILGAKGGAVRILDENNDGMPDTLYVADNPDPAQAIKVWRWNYEGWAGSKNGYGGPFSFGATLDDGILAEAVTAANLVAGTIQSRDGETFFLDLDRGILRIKAISDLQEEVDQNAASTSQQITSLTQTTEQIVVSALGEYVKTGDFENFKKTLNSELAVMADKVAISVSESVKSELSPTDNQLQAQIDEIRMNYDFTADGQYIGKKGADTAMRLVNDMMQILVSGAAATTVDKTGLTASEANIRTLHMGDYTWALGNDGHLMLA